MVSMQRRLNSTGRKRIPRDRILIDLEPPLDSASFPRVSAQIDLTDQSLDGSASVALEASFRSSSMRMACGTVNAITPPQLVELTEIDRGGAIKFRLLVIAPDGSGRIVAAAEGIRPARSNDDAERRALLPVSETDLREELWGVNVDRRNGPRLLVNSRVPGLAVQLRTNGLYQGLILPHALREVLRGLPPEGESEDDALWGDDWRRFLRALDVPTEPENWNDEDAKELWIEEAIDTFCSLKGFAERLRMRSVDVGDE